MPDSFKNNFEQELPVYICDITETSSLEHALVFDNFPHHQLILCVEGTGVLCSEYTTEIIVRPGMLIFVNSAILFSLRPYDSDFRFKSIAFNGIYSYNYLQYFGFEHVSVIESAEKEVYKLFSYIFREFDAGADGSTLNLSVALYDLIGITGTILKNQSHIHTYEEYIAKASYDFIKSHIHEKEININLFIERLNITAKQLDDILLTYYRHTSDELIRRYRMEYAKQAVFKVGQNTDSGFCRQCGFENMDIFSDAFMKYTGMSVREYLALSRGI